jgi:hypothetical protein
VKLAYELACAAVTAVAARCIRLLFKRMSRR